MGDPISAASVFVPQTPSGDETRRRLAGKSPQEVAKEFEAILLAQVIGAMRKTVPESGVLEASANRKMLDGAFDQEVARSLAAKGGLGIAEQIVGQIERQQAARDAASGRVAVAAPRSAASIGAVTTTSRAAALTATSAVEPNATVRPVAGEVSSPFGMRNDPFTGAPRFHAGIDVAAPRGSEIRAVADGEVVFSGWRRGGAGRVVEVRHADGLITSYAHAERTLVRTGQHVVAGEVVATVGSSGRASGPHLHFSALRDGQAVDPSGLLEHGQAVVGSATGALGGAAGSAADIQVPSTPGRYPDRARSEWARETS
jgi:murein DD-endopeptidase MepM/ murein hydrolase activator NlpD